MNSDRKLPIEVVIDIIEYFAWSSRNSAKIATLLCWWAREISLPALWKIITIHPSFQLSGSSRRNRSLAHLNKRDDVFPIERAPLVRAIWTDKTRLSERSIRSVFDFCRSAEHLALSWDRFRDLGASQYLYNRADIFIENDRMPDHVGLLTRPGKPEHLDSMHYPVQHRESPCRSLTILDPWVLFMHKWSAFSTRTGCSVFFSLTHLRLVDCEPRNLPLSFMPHLTHLAIPPPKRYGTASRIRLDQPLLDLPGVLESEACPRLQMVILTVDEDVETHSMAEMQSAAAMQDDRLYVIHAPCRTQHVRASWERSVRGGPDLWTEAAQTRDTMA